MKVWKWLMPKDKIIHQKDVEITKEILDDVKYEFEIKQPTIDCKHEWIKKAQYDPWLKDSYYCCRCGLGR